MAAARYWRLVGLATASGSLDLTEIHLYSAGTRVAPGAALTCSHTPVAGVLTNLIDADLATSCKFAPSQVSSGGFFLQFDCGTPVDVNSIRLGSGVRAVDFLDVLQLQSSTDGATWGAARSIGKFIWPGANAMSPVPVDGDPLFASVTLLLPCDGIAGSSVLYDASLSGLTPSAVGAAVLSDVVSRYGAVSWRTGVSALAFARYANNAAFGFGLGDYALEMSVYPVGGGGTERGLLDFRSVNGSDAATWFLDTSGRLSLYSGVLDGAVGATVPAGQWSELMLQRVAGVTTAYIGGVPQWSTSRVIDFGASRPLGIGGGVFTDGVGSSLLPAYIGAVRITKGVARYPSGGYTPAGPFPAQVSQGVDLLAVHTTVIKGGVAAGASVPLHRVPKTLRALVARDIEHGGLGVIWGTTKTEVSPDVNVPTKARVVLLHQRSNLPVRTTWSNATTGVFEFAGIDTTQQFIALAEDALGNYRPVAANKVTPEVAP